MTAIVDITARDSTGQYFPFPDIVQANEYNPLSQVPQIKDTLDSEIPVLEATVRELARAAVGRRYGYVALRAGSRATTSALDGRT